MKNLNQILLMAITITAASCGNNENIFIASGYSSENKPDVIVCRLMTDGNTEVLSEFFCGDNPSYFAVGDSGLIYFINEVDSFNLKHGGGITTLRLDKKTNTLSKAGSINQGAAGPCHITLSADRKYLITANYGSGSVSVVKLDKSGIPSEVTDVIKYGERSHPHMTMYNERNMIYYVTDLGLDRIYLLRLDTENGLLINADAPFVSSAAGSGPRHMVLNKPYKNLMVINELNSTISVFDAVPHVPVLKNTVTTLPESFKDESFCADIHLSPDSRFLYGSNRGHNSIVVFKAVSDGTLSLKGHVSCGGTWPRNFALDPDGKYLLTANQRSDSISVSQISRKTGMPALTDHFVNLNAPACIRFLK